MRMGALREYRDLLLIVSTCFLTYFDKSATEWSKKRASELFIYIYIYYINLCFTLGSCWYKLSQRLRALQLDSFARRHQLFPPFGVWQLTSKDCAVNGCICVKSREFFISKVTLLSNCFHFSKYVHFKVQPQIHYFSWLHDCIGPRAQGFFVSVTF